MTTLPSRPRWLHPALLRLQAVQFRAQCLKMLRGFRTPRRFVLSMLAAILAVVWTAQTVTSILFRESADPERLRQWMPMAMFAYVVYHVLKAALRPTKDPMEWSSAEIEWLTASPLSRRDLLGFRLSTIASAAALKAACFALVMIPDLHLPMIAAATMWLALLVIDLARLVLECFVWGLSPQSKRRFAWMTVGIAAVALLSVTVQTGLRADLPAGWIYAMQAGLGCLLQFDQQWWVALASYPFQQATDAILATQINATLAMNFAVIALTTLVAGLFVVRLDGWSIQSRRALQRMTYQSLLRAGSRESLSEIAVGAPQAHATKSPGNHLKRGKRVSAWRGAATLAWSQALGMRQFAGSLIVSFVVPAVLTLMPVVSPMRGISLALQIGGALAFYSYVLLPTALKFDFRRNIDRVLTYKRMPLSAWAVTAGQLATPVLAISGFQFVVFALAVSISPVTAKEAGIGLLLLAPANVLVFAFENLIFLLYPYRLSQEGIEIFLRSVLMFTGKGLLLLGALVSVLGWSFACQWLCRGAAVQPVVFLAGLATAVTLLAASLVCLLNRAYRRFDVSEDMV